MKKIKVFVESSPITEERISGIGHMTVEMIKALESHPNNHVTFEIILIVCKDRSHLLEQWGFDNVRVKKIAIPQRLFNIIWKFDLLPPMDIFFGKGVYIFPNYKNWRLLLSKSFTYICDISYLVVPQFVSPKNREFLKKNIRKWSVRADRVLCISKNAQEEIIQHLNVTRSKTLLVYCGIDPNIFYKRSEHEIKEFKTKYNLPKHYILYLSNLEPRKNVVNLIEAYKLLPLEMRKKYALLLVGGGGWLNEPIIKAIEDAKAQGYHIVQPKEYIADSYLPLLHSGAEVLVHPAHYEGFGISPLQAMACSTPVIVANNSSLPEVVADAGLMIDENSIVDMSDKINQLLRDEGLKKTLISKGLKRANIFTWKQSADNLEKEFRF